MTVVRTASMKRHSWVWFVVGFSAGLIVLVLATRMAGAATIENDKPVMVYIASYYDGVFYAGEYFGDEPFVKVGSDVERDTVVGTIEGMRRFQQFAGVRGKIVELLVGDSKMVYMGQPLFKVQLAPTQNE